MYVTIIEFIETKFSDTSKPNERSLKRWIDNGDFPFETMKMGGKYYVDIDTPKKENINPLVERILSHGQTP